MRKHSGFTLIELLVVLVVISLISGLAVPRLFSTLAGTELKTVSRKTVTFLHFARDTAYYKKDPVKAVFDLDEDRIVIVRYQEKKTGDEEDFSIRPKMEWVEIKSYSLPENVRIDKCIKEDETVASGRFDIRFFPAGNSTGGTVSLANSRERTFEIKVEFITGNARILEQTDS